MRSLLYDTIMYYCKLKGITAGRMCADTHISRGLISDLKYGRKFTITLPTARRIAEYLGISVNELLPDYDTGGMDMALLLSRLKSARDILDIMIKDVEDCIEKS